MAVEHRRKPEDETARSSDERVRESEERYRAIADSVFEGIVLHLDGKILDVNEVACQVLGYTRSDLIGRSVLELIAPESRDLVLEKIRTGDTGPYEAFGLRRDGTRIVRELRAAYVPYQGRQVRVAAVRDITDRKRAEEALRRSVAEQRAVEEQLRQAQKLDSIGRLAGGVAHDLNNVLTAVLGYAGLLAEGIRAGQPSMTDLEEIVRAAERARDLTQHLLAFARKQVMQPRTVDPNAVVEDAERLLRRLLSENIAIDLRLARDVAPIEADPARIGQVIVNLAVNARDAMPHGGTLTIETANVDLDELDAARHPGTVKPGPHVMIAVSDTGVGMSRDVLEHIFEPFYTTKTVGKGTGLGLAVVYGIVKQSGGHIWAYSEPGLG
jgi:PAS domain S-box-containing protein